MVAQLSANMFAGSLPTGPAPTEAELRAQYDAAKAASAKRRAEGFLSQVVLPGEQDFESFRALQLTPYGGLGVADTLMPGMRGSSTSNIPAVPLDNSFSAGFFDLADKTELTNVPSTVGRILADRNTTPEERSRRMYMAPGKPSPRVGPPPLPLYDTPGSASGIEIKGDPNFIDDQDISKILGFTPPTQDPDRADFYAFKSTLRDPGDMGRYIAPGEEMSYEDFVKFGRPANLAAAEAAGYSGGALLSDNLGNKVSLNSLINATPEEALKGGGLLPNSGFSGNLEGTAEAGGIFGPAVAGGGLVPDSGASVSGILPNVVKDPNPINYYMGRPTNMTTDAEIANFEAVNDPNAPVDPGFSPNLMGAGRRPVELNPMGVGPGALMVPDAIAGISDQPGAGEMQTKPVASTGTPPVGIPDPDMTQRPMPFSGLASLTKLPMFQEFATKLEAEHPEASQLFSQMFMGSSQRPMPYQNPFMGMGMGSFYPMMGGMGMGMGGYNPMMGMGGGFNPMMGGMGMGGYSPFMGMNPMMGMSGGGLGSFYPQPSTYGPPQSMPSMGGYPTPPQSSPFGGAMRGYYA